MEPKQNTDRQQIVERIKEATNVLVTVSANPSVDQLSGAIGLTLLLNKLGKHGTAVFSGEIPSTLEFLQPEKTLEHNTDSLRDFIIALDKSKADKLRYKVEEKTVKIFITPYRTSLSVDDLDFSQGDFNVDAVIALGVHQRDDLDHAISSQGRILHDATIISINNQSSSSLGTINWHDDAASSLCEMLVLLGESLKKDFLDTQMATAFLTGIVAETDRFSNDKTAPTTMTIAGRLMTAGANQQLIATQLETPEPEVPESSDGSDPPSSPPSDTAAKKTTSHHKDTPPPEGNDDGMLRIAHDAPPPDNNADEPDADYDQDDEPLPEPLSQIHIDEHGNVRQADELQAQTVLQEAAKAAEPAEHPHIEVERRVLPDPAKPVQELFKPAGEPAKPLGEDSFLPQGGDTEELDLPPVAPSTVPLLNRDSPSNTSAASQPPPAASQTLSQLEATVHSPHQQAAPSPAPFAMPPAEPPSQPLATDAPPSLDAARDAVAGVVETSDTQEPLDPIAALNALPVDLDLGHSQPPPALPALDEPPTSSATTPANQPAPPPQPSFGPPPPPVPPPMMPPPAMPPSPPANDQNNFPSSSNPFTLPPAL